MIAILNAMRRLGFIALVAGLGAIVQLNPAHAAPPACPELLQQFEEKQRRMQFGSSVAANGDGDDDGEEGATAAPGLGPGPGADGAAAIEDEDGAVAAASKRKHDERDGPGGGLASPPTGAEGPPASSASDTWERIVRLRRPEGARASPRVRVVHLSTVRVSSRMSVCFSKHAGRTAREIAPQSCPHADNIIARCVINSLIRLFGPGARASHPISIKNSYPP